LWQAATALVGPLKDAAKLINRHISEAKLSTSPYDSFPSATGIVAPTINLKPTSPVRKARRGKRRRPHIDARLDLHGLTQSEAYASLKAALLSERAKGSSILLVITGKGSKATQSIDSIGILRKQTPLWLSTFAEVTRIELAHRDDGGDGALYVYIKKQS
jgi:DNA-nicking Smr family endonuclease